LGLGPLVGPPVGPTLSRIDPAEPPKEVPVFRFNEPLVESADWPVDTTTLPVDTWEEEAPMVANSKLPVTAEVFVAPPVMIVTPPPLPARAVPAERITFPPTPLELTPTMREISPAETLDPDRILMLPEVVVAAPD